MQGSLLGCKIFETLRRTITRFTSHLEFVICRMELHSEVYLHTTVPAGRPKTTLDSRDSLTYLSTSVVTIKISSKPISSPSILNFIPLS